jgi:Domain of unknown function (DUF4399)
MTQSPRSRNDLPQILVFFVLIVALLGALVVGGKNTPQALASKEVTPEVTMEMTAEAAGTVAATAEPVEPRVFFRVPTAYAVVPPIFTVEMGAEGLIVEPAGDVHEGAGHFHLLIDEPYIPAGQPIPKDATHLHFGDGSTSTELELSPGDHVLRLQFADGQHIAIAGYQYRAEIEVTVVEGAAARAVYFVTPTDGAIVPETITVIMAATGLEIMPAGEILPDAGHLHVLIDTPFIEAGEAIPKDDTHLHLGKGQLSADLTLTPGEHVLRLQFANGAHIALDGDEYRDEMTVTVTQ